MIALFSDTHSHRGHELEGAALETAREADAVVHAGDFTSPAALEAFRDVCSTLYAVHGNADSSAVREQLPPARTIAADGVRLAVTHRRDGGATELSLFGRSREAAIVVSGHTHRPTIQHATDLLLLNPGSHAQPRGNRPGFATVTTHENEIEGRLHELDGTIVERQTIEG